MNSWSLILFPCSLLQPIIFLNDHSLGGWGWAKFLNTEYALKTHCLSLFLNLQYSLLKRKEKKEFLSDHSTSLFKNQPRFSASLRVKANDVTSWLSRCSVVSPPPLSNQCCPLLKDLQQLQPPFYSWIKPRNALASGPLHLTFIL